MIFECAVLGAGATVVNDALKIEYMKSIQMDLSDQEKQDFLQNPNRRFIHFTPKERAKKIMSCGFLIPTHGVMDNHYTKTIDANGNRRNADMVYMFDSETFSVEDYIRNLPKKNSPFNGCYEYYAVSTRPDEHEINNFKRRAHDGAITYEGRLDIDGTDTRLTKYILSLDEQGKYKFDEVPMDYDYNPPQELLDKLAQDKRGNFRYVMDMYMSEVKLARSSLKKFKLQRDEYKEQIRKKKDFARANKQFQKEEKENVLVFEKDGRKITVKNVELEQIGGKTLQKIAIMENDDRGKNKGINEVTKFCYMDEYDITNIPEDIASKYFFNNLDKVKDSESYVPEYIGLPLQDLETGDVVNEYDTTFDKKFKQYMSRRQMAINSSEKTIKDMKQKKSLFGKVKAMFSKLFNKSQEVKLLPKEMTDKEQLANLGYSSVEAMNNDDPEAKMFSALQQGKYPPDEVVNYYVNEQVSGIEKDTKNKSIGER